MSPIPKATREPVIEDFVVKPEIYNSFVSLFVSGIERMAETQKKIIDLAVQQNADMVDMLKKSAEKLPGTPRFPVLDAVAKSVSGYADTQKYAIDMAVEQSHAWTDAWEDRATGAKKPAESAVAFAQHAVERSAAVQKKALENAAVHTKAVMEAAKQQFGVKGGSADAAAESFNRGLDTILDAQKQFIDLAVTH